MITPDHYFPPWVSLATRTIALSICLAFGIVPVRRALIDCKRRSLVWLSISHRPSGNDACLLRSLALIARTLLNRSLGAQLILQLQMKHFSFLCPITFLDIPKHCNYSSHTEAQNLPSNVSALTLSRFNAMAEPFVFILSKRLPRLLCFDNC